MPARKATASGRWSQSIWDVTPSVGDDVFANGFTVEIDQNVNVGSLRTTLSTAYAVAGGGFTLYQPLSVVLTGDVIVEKGTTFVNYSSAGTTTLICRNVLQNYSGGGTISLIPTYSPVVANMSTGNLVVSAASVIRSTNASGSNMSAHAIFNYSEGNIYITSAAISASPVNPGSGLTNGSGGIFNNSIGNIYVTSNVFGGTTNSYGIFNNSNGSIVVNGNLTGGSAAAAVFQNSTGTLLVSGTITASANAHGAVSSSTAARNEFTGTFVNSISGRQAVYCARYLVHPKMFDSATVQAVDRSGTYVTYIAPEAYSTSYVPHVSSVALGTAYAAVSSLSGVAVNITVQLSGTMVVPSEASVSFGTLVGQTTGTAVNTSQLLQQVWNTNINTLTAANSLGARLKNTATVQEVGQQIQNLNL